MPLNNARPIINPDAPTIVKVDPNISFSQDEFDIYEKNLKGVYEFDWFQYLVNTDNVGYSVKLSDGLTFIDDSKFTWSDSGNYTLTLTTTENKYYNSIDIFMTFHIYTLNTSGVEYIPNPLEIVDGDLQIEYFNVEKREGVYMFDLIKPNNPNSLGVKYKIEGKNGCTIDDDDFKVHIAKKGRYKITAYFEGNTTYRPSETVYYLVYGQDGDEDDKDPYDNQDDGNTKKYPNISFSKSSVSFDKNDSGIYDVLKANNPNNVQLSYTTYPGNLIEGDTKIQVPEDFTGNIKITCTSAETSEYYSQTITYIITVSISEEEKSDDYEFHFSDETDIQPIRQSHKYTVLPLTNTSPLDYTLTVSKPATVSADKTEIECGITGTFIVIAKTIPDSVYKSKEARYTLVIEESDKIKPIFEFKGTQQTWQQNKDNAYPILDLNNPNKLEYTISCDNPSASIKDNMLYFNELGTITDTITITITAVSKATDIYESVTATYLMYITKATKQNAGISFTYDRINIKKLADETGGYPVQELNNPNNVALNPFVSSAGSVRDGRLYVNGPTELYIQVTSIEDDNYFATTARYTVNIYTGLKSWPNFQLHNDYDIIDNLNKTKNIELLRWPKRDNLSFNSSEWRVSVSKPICTISNITMTETDTDCVLYGDIKFGEEGYVRANITFYGNAEWESASNMGLNIRYTKKTLKSPELSFPNYYVIVDQSVTNTYVIQEVLNPFDVEVNYYISNGDLNGNILTFNGTGNIIITCTSVATDVYESQSVQYTLHINKPKKISPGLYFEYPIVEYEQGTYSANEYPLQDVLPNPLPVPIKSWNATNQAIVYYNNGHSVKYNGTGDVIVSVTSQETALYYSETVYYTMRIVESSSLLDPELYYDPNYGEVYVNDNGEYNIPKPHIADESLRRYLTFSTQYNLGNISEDGTMLSVDGTWNVRVYAEFAGDGTYRAASASYVLRIQAKPAKKLPDIRFKYDPQQFPSNNANGEYPLQITFVGEQADLPGKYSADRSDVRIDVENKKVYWDGKAANILITYTTYETEEFLPGTCYYTLDVYNQALQYLNAEVIEQNIDISGPYNTDIEIRAVKWLRSKNYTFDASHWRISRDSSEYYCTPKIVRSEHLDENYDVLIISCAFSKEDRATLRISFLGDGVNFNTQNVLPSIRVNFTRAKGNPNYYFNPDRLTIPMGTPGNVYKLSDYTQLKNVPSDLDVNVELLSNSPDTFTDGVVTINRQNVNSFFIRAWNNETANYNAYSTQFRLAWTNQYVKGTPDLTLKNKIGGVLNFYWDPNNNYIVEIYNPDNIDIPDSDIIWDTENQATVTPLGNYHYKVSLHDTTNTIHQFNIRFTTRDTLEYESVTDYAIFSISEYDRTDVDYTMYDDYTYNNITVGETITGIVLLEFRGDDVGTVDDFEVTVQPNGTINYISVSNVKIIDNKLICDVRTWSLADIGSNNIYVTYKGNSLYNDFSDHLNFAYSIDPQYVRDNVISVTFNNWPVEQHIPDDNWYDLQPINDVYGVNPNVYYEEYYDIDDRTNKYHTDGLGDYTITPYTKSFVRNNILYKATRIQYTFQLVENTSYIDDGSIWFDGQDEQPKNVQGKYRLQGIHNPNMWTLEWFAEDALGNEVTISDGYINYNDVGRITVYARTVGVYPNRVASYYLYIYAESPLQDPGLYYQQQNVTYKISDRYAVSMPQGNDSLLPYCTLSPSKGYIDNIDGEYWLSGNINIGDTIIISCYFSGNETYRPKTVSYKVYIVEEYGSANLNMQKITHNPNSVNYPYYDYIFDYNIYYPNKRDVNIAYIQVDDGYVFTKKDFRVTITNIDLTVTDSMWDLTYEKISDFNIKYYITLKNQYNNSDNNDDIRDIIYDYNIKFLGNNKYAPNEVDVLYYNPHKNSTQNNFGPWFSDKYDDEYSYEYAYDNIYNLYYIGYDTIDNLEVYNPNNIQYNITTNNMTLQRGALYYISYDNNGQINIINTSTQNITDTITINIVNCKLLPENIKQDAYGRINSTVGGGAYNANKIILNPDNYESGVLDSLVYNLSNIISRYVLEYYQYIPSDSIVYTGYYKTRQHELEYFVDSVYEKDGTKSDIPITFNNTNFKLYVGSGYTVWNQTVILKIRIKDTHYEWDRYGEYFYPVEIRFSRDNRW